MSNPESFIDEVTDEVRRDRLFAAFRKYGWIGVVLVLGVVGGSAWNEWSKAKANARAQAFGDAVIDALDLGGAGERRAGLAAISVDGAQKALLDLILASDPAEDKAATLAALDAVAADATLSPAYRDLAVLRRVIVAGSDMPAADRRTALEPLAVAGRPYRPLAQEQLAYLQIEEGQTEAALTALSALATDQEAPAPLRARVSQMITALGGTPPAAAQTAPDAPSNG